MPASHHRAERRKWRGERENRAGGWCPRWGGTGAGESDAAARETGEQGGLTAPRRGLYPAPCYST